MKKMLLLGAVAAASLALWQSPARAVDDEKLNKAIAAGVAYLKQAQQPDGGFGPAPDYTLGATALCGMTLLECGVAANDDSVKKVTEYVRKRAVNETKTYCIALAILFLDKLREPADVALIESLTVRLIAGQTAAGAWAYNCPQISADEVKRLTDIVKNPELVGRRELPKGDKAGDDAKRSPKDLPKEIKDQLALVGRGGSLGGTNPADQAGGNRQGGGGVFEGDNSNTQFATLALWVARRHGLPVEPALGRVAMHFRKTVNADGSWSYTTQQRLGPPIPPQGGGEPSMTCAGLLAIAISYGVAVEQAEEKAKGVEGDPAKAKGSPLPDIAKDPAITKALKALAGAVGQPAAKGKAGGVIPKIEGTQYYYLWSLERMCMGLDLDTVGGKDWYEWGSEVLMANQQTDGSWSGGFGAYKADTCFALLFLKRSNFARDLSARLKGKLAQNTLRGGVGGEGLKEKVVGGLTVAKDGGDKPAVPKETLPPNEAKEVERLTRAIVDAKGEIQGKLLTDFHNERDRKYTEALLTAINQLDGDGKKGARKVLAERLSKEGKEKPDKLTDYLGDRDGELRRAAALACALNDSKQHVPQLIGLLRDREALVGRAAWASLKSITGQNFGPTADATEDEKAKAVETWREWWKKNGK